MDELSQLDELVESDILEALGEERPQNDVEDEISLVDFNENEEDIILEDAIDNSTTEKNNDSKNEDEISLEDFHEEQEPVDENNNTADNQVNTIETTIASTDIASLLSQLLANKTIEITIKIKD